MKLLRKYLEKQLYKYKYDSDSYVSYLREKGVDIGDHVKIFFPRETTIEALNPHLLSIGSHVQITGPATILTHDYSVCVTKVYKNGEILGNQKPTIIEDNVFIGWGACVLAGSHIRKNTIIRAQAVVSGELEEGSVYAGNPAKKYVLLTSIMIIEKRNSFLRLWRCSEDICKDLDEIRI